MPTIDFKDLFSSFVLFVPRLVVAIVILVIFWILARLLRRAAARYGRTKHLSPDVVNLLEQVSEVALLSFGVVTALGTVGINVEALVAGLGLVGFALGFALKDLLSNFLAGFLILMYNPFVRGDFIIVTGQEGLVTEINLRYTILQTDERKVLIPNATLFSNPVAIRKQPPKLSDEEVSI
jgi:small-conductance mechanosensitive channel